MLVHAGAGQPRQLSVLKRYIPCGSLAYLPTNSDCADLLDLTSHCYIVGQDLTNFQHFPTCLTMGEEAMGQIAVSQ